VGWRDDFLRIACELLEKLRNMKFELIDKVATRIWLRIDKVVFGGDHTRLAQLVRNCKRSSVEIL